MLYHNYKDAEQNLKERFRDKVVRVEPIEPADVYYTDGDAAKYICKLNFTGTIFRTIYLPLKINFNHTSIVEDWLKFTGLNG